MKFQIFSLCVRQAASPIPAPRAAVDAEQEAWDLAKRSHSAGAYQAYASAYPQGRYAQAAQVALAGFRPVQLASLRPESVQQVVQPTPAQPVRPSSATAGQTIKDCADCPELVVIPAGSFQMGSNDGTGNGEPVHLVNIKSFALGKYEVTQGQWRAVMGSNPSGFSKCGDNCPVEQVSWNDIQQYIQKINAKSGQSYRLPSEAEWEYAARAGSTTKYAWGDSIGRNNANCDGCGSQWDNHSTSPVGSFKPNAFGLYDMHGNVWEVVQVWYDDNYRGAPTDGSSWESGGELKYSVLRGGSWHGIARDTRADDRYMNSIGDEFQFFNRNAVYGFRLARTAP